MKKTFSLLILLILGLVIASNVYAYEGYEGYEQGRKWGHAHGITDTDYNSEDTSAFAEGVRQAARERHDQG
jgi:hypothetical protein